MTPNIGGVSSNLPKTGECRRSKTHFIVYTILGVSRQQKHRAEKIAKMAAGVSFGDCFLLLRSSSLIPKNRHPPIYFPYKPKRFPTTFIDAASLSSSSCQQGFWFSFGRKPCKDLNAQMSAVRQLTGSITAAEGLRFAIVVARFNEIITKPLLEGALETFKKHSVKEEDIDVVWVPGSFEIGVVAEKLGKSRKYQAVLCIGAVIKGDTSHYDAVANSAASGVLSAGLNSGVPCIFGVLTCDDVEQALNRAGGKAGNKGAEAALTAIEMASLFEHHLKF